MYYGKMTSRRDTRRILCEENSANIFLNTNRTNLMNHLYLFILENYVFVGRSA